MNLHDSNQRRTLRSFSRFYLVCIFVTGWQAFGEHLKSPINGLIDRKALGGEVFGNPSKRKVLESIVWPEIRILAEEHLRHVRDEAKSPLAVLEAAILVEAGWMDLVDEVWVVTVDDESAVARLMARNNLTRDQAQIRVDAQKVLAAERAKVAHVLIDNSGNEKQLELQVQQLWDRVVL
jgi:dephospho-CoA kinase